MNQLAIHNPATGALITTVDADDAASVAVKAVRARAAQAAWGATPLAERKACIERFAAAVRAELEPLAAIMTRETGKPIKMSRNELNGLMGRIDFFLSAVDASVATETVFVDGGMTEQIQHLFAHVFQLETQIEEHLRGHALLLAKQTQENVLCANVVMIEIARLLHRILNHLFGARCLRKLAHGYHVGPALHEFFDFHANLPQVDVKVFKNVGRHAAALFDQSQEHVLGADVFMVKALGLLIGQLHDFASTVSKTLIHRVIP